LTPLIYCIGNNGLDSLKQKSESMANDILQTHFESQMTLANEPSVEDPVVFLKEFYKK
jgi:Tat protein secretion system quality control protein TatD with DNase activity